MGGEAMCLLKNFLHLETVGEKVGLELNRSKFEVIGHHGDTSCVHIIYGINLPKTCASATFLDAPLLAGPQLDSVLERKRLELRRLSQRLELKPSHDCLYLLYATYS
jgi:hypothetical protein